MSSLLLAFDGMKVVVLMACDGAALLLPGTDALYGPSRLCQMLMVVCCNMQHQEAGRLGSPVTKTECTGVTVVLTICSGTN